MKPQLPVATTQRAEIIVHPQSRSVIVDAARVLCVDPAKVCTLLRNVWKTSKGASPLTDQEMFQGLSMIARFGLDPIAKEVYVTRDGSGRLMTIVGIDGWIKILDRTDHYDGHEQTVEFDEKGKLFSATTTIYSSRRSHPTTYTAYASEYEQVSGNVAKKMPIHMLRVFSLRHAARMFTALGGNVFSEEEARYMEAEEARMAEADMKAEESANMGDFMEKMLAPHPDETQAIAPPEPAQPPAAQPAQVAPPAAPAPPKTEPKKPQETKPKKTKGTPVSAKDLFGDALPDPPKPGYYQACVGRLKTATTLEEFDAIWRSICADPRTNQELNQSHAEMLNMDYQVIRRPLEEAAEAAGQEESTGEPSE